MSRSYADLALRIPLIRARTKRATATNAVAGIAMGTKMRKSLMRGELPNALKARHTIMNATGVPNSEVAMATSQRRMSANAATATTIETAK